MNLARVARVLAGFTLFFSLAQLVPLALAWREAAHDGVDTRTGFVASVSIGLGLVVLLWLLGRRAEGQMFRKESLAIVGFAWLFAGVIGALPFLCAGAVARPIDALFETISGLTTTGASVFSSGDNLAIEQLGRSLLLWRSLLHWMGGIGVVFAFVVLLPAMGLTGKSLLASESVGINTERMRPRLQAKARGILAFYIGISTASTLGLWLSGLGWFDAVNHSFAAVSTGGFSTRNASVGAFDNAAAEGVLIATMLVSAMNFGLLIAAVFDRQPRVLLRSAEFKTFLALVTVVVAAATASLVSTGMPLLASLRAASFNVVSMMTCTGFATADFQRWPPLVIILLFAMTIVGGCSGSTSGGFKMVRLVVGCRLLSYTLRHYVRPTSVERIKLDGEVMPAAVISDILALILLWLATIVCGAITYTLTDGLPFLSALTSSTTMMANAGPAMCPIDSTGAVIGPDLGPAGGYGAMSVAGKSVMCAQMLLGRLELLLPLALFIPAYWRR